MAITREPYFKITCDECCQKIDSATTGTDKEGQGNG